MDMQQEKRMEYGWLAYKGDPLKNVPVDPPMFEGHPRVARKFSKAIAHFVARVFHNREQEFYAEANDAIIRNSRFYIENIEVRDDRDSFYWNIGDITRAMLRYDSLGMDEAGLISKEAEQVFLEMALGYCHDMSKVLDAASEGMTTWHIYESENHHVQRNSAIWLFMVLLMRHGYGEEVMADGGTLKDHFEAWSEFFSVWMTQRAGHSMFVEIQSKHYGVDTLKNIYPLYDFAPDPELRRKTGDFITLFWARWAEEQLNGNQGGGQARVYPYDAIKSDCSNRDWAWYYTGVGEFRLPDEMDYVMLDCSYRMPELIVKLITSPEKRGVYTVESRPFGKAAKDDLFPNYRVETDWGRIYRYSYCTPRFILGTLMCPQLEKKDWVLISSQNRFQGVVFGKKDAMILPIPEPDILHNLQSTIPTVGFNAFWSEQCEGTLITQRCGKYDGGMRIFFSEAGGIYDGLTYEEGWFFSECDGAYAAVKVCRGGYHWEEDPYIAGRWMYCDEKDTPVILETADCTQFISFEEFKKAVTSQKVNWENGRLCYHSLYGHEFVFLTEEDGESTIDGEYYVKKPDISFRSPFVNAEWGGKEVRITFENEELVLNF